MSTKFGLQNHFDYAVVGGGVMGVSAALALRRGSPSAKVIIFEGDEMKKASKGICKIIRTPYIDKNYILLAEEAKKRWESELPYCNFYRRITRERVISGYYESISDISSFSQFWTTGSSLLVFPTALRFTMFLTSSVRHIVRTSFPYPFLSKITIPLWRSLKPTLSLRAASSSF